MSPDARAASVTLRSHSRVDDGIFRRAFVLELVKRHGQQRAHQKIPRIAPASRAASPESLRAGNSRAPRRSPRIALDECSFASAATSASLQCGIQVYALAQQARHRVRGQGHQLPKQRELAEDSIRRWWINCTRPFTFLIFSGDSSKNCLKIRGTRGLKFVRSRRPSGWRSLHFPLLRK